MPHLLQTLESCSVGRSLPIEPLLRLWLLVLVGTIGTAILYQSPAILVPGGYVLAYSAAVPFLYLFARLNSPLCRAVSQALMRIAAQDPVPSLRSAVPELRWLAEQGMQQTRETRDAARLAAHRIEQLTEEVRTLPIAAAPVPDPAEMPVPAASPGPAAEHLPRASTGEAAG